MEVFWSWACIVGAMLMCLITSSTVMFFYHESAKQTVPTRIWSWPVIGETFSFLRMGACDLWIASPGMETYSPPHCCLVEKWLL